MLWCDPLQGKEEPLNTPMIHHQPLNIHAEELGTMEALSYSLCFCKKRHTTVPLRWNINIVPINKISHFPS